MNKIDPYFKLRPPPETSKDDICRCEGIKPIKLMSALGYNPVHCIDCNLEVAPERLSLDGKLVEVIASWNSIYDAVYRLWLVSGEYEAWAKNQLLDIHGPVNKRGLELRKDLNNIRRCYYWYFQDQSEEEFEPLARCPNCGQKFTVYQKGIFRQYICEGCSIITVGE